jgi:hypothetical protein
MMRVRGAIVLAAGLPFWVYIVRFINEVKKPPFGYELGSVAFPMLTQYRVAGLVAVIFFLLGLSLLVADFFNWNKKRPTDRPDNRTRDVWPAFHSVKGNQELADVAMELCKSFRGSARVRLLPPRPQRQSPRQLRLRFLSLRQIHEVPTPPR